MILPILSYAFTILLFDDWLVNTLVLLLAVLLAARFLYMFGKLLWG